MYVPDLGPDSYAIASCDLDEYAAFDENLYVHEKQIPFEKTRLVTRDEEREKKRIRMRHKYGGKEDEKQFFRARTAHELRNEKDKQDPYLYEPKPLDKDIDPLVMGDFDAYTCLHNDVDAPILY